MPTADEIIVRLTAQDGGLNAGMDEAAAKVKASTDAMQASVSNAMNTFRDFDNIQKGSIKTAQDVAAAQATLTAAQATGAYTTEELAAKQAILDAAMLKVGNETEAAAGMINRFTSNSRTMYSASALITDAMTGQFSRMRREVAALGNETGLMSAAMRAAVGPAGLVAAGLAAIAALAYTGAQRVEEFQQALEKSNDASGLSAADLRVLAESAGHITNSFTMADEAVKDLAADGHYSAQQIQALSLAIVQYAQGTGESVKEVMRVVSEIANDPKKALEELRDKMGALSPQQAEIIENMIRMGQKQQAIDAEFGAFETRGQEAFDHVNQQAGGFLRTLDLIVNRMGVGMRLAQDGVSNHFGEMVSSANPMLGIWGAMASSAKDLNDETDKTAQKLANAKAQTQSGPAKGSFGAFQQQGEQGVDLSGNLESQLKTLEVAQKVSYDDRKSFESEYWAYVLSKVQEGSAQYIEAYLNLESVDRQISQAGERAFDDVQRKRQADARRSAEAAKQAEQKANAATMNGLEVKRAATQEYSAQRIAMDAQIVAMAEKLYGQDSSQYRAALQQKLSDTQQFIQSQKELAVSQADSDRQIAEAKIANAREQAQTEFDAGRITASQLLQTELDLDRQKLAADIAYYNAKKQLDINDAKATLEDNKQIVLAKLQFDQQMQKDEQKFFKDSEKNWKQYSQRIVGSVQTAVNGMLFQHQSLRSGVASIAESMAENFIEVAVMPPLEKWIEAEGMKLSAFLGTLTTQTTAEETHRAANTAADIADKTAGVIRAAGLAGAQGTASFAGAPWPIDIGAPVFGAAMAATAASFVSMASAEGGWERVPADGTMARLHYEEMVLPRDVANPIRDMAKRGGGGGGDTFHIHANDARSFMDMARRRPGDLAKLAKQMRSRGYTV